MIGPKLILLGCSDRWLPTSSIFSYIQSHFNYYMNINIAQTMCKTRFGSQAMILNGFKQKKIGKKHQWNLRPFDSGKAMQNVHIFLEYFPEQYLRNNLLSTLWPKLPSARPEDFSHFFHYRCFVFGENDVVKVLKFAQWWPNMWCAGIKKSIEHPILWRAQLTM